MPSKLPRVVAIVTPEQFAVIDDLAKAARLSRSRIVGDILEQALPVISRSAAMIRQAAALTEEARAALRPTLHRREGDAMRAASDAYRVLADTEAAIRKARGNVGRMRSVRPTSRAKSVRQTPR
jgi:hypothetical protein